MLCELCWHTLNTRPMAMGSAMLRAFLDASAAQVCAGLSVASETLSPELTRDCRAVYWLQFAFKQASEQARASTSAVSHISRAAMAAFTYLEIYRTTRMSLLRAHDWERANLFLSVTRSQW